VLFIDFILFGVSLTLFGAAIPEVIRAYSWPYSTAGVILAAGSFGFIAATLSAGYLAERFGTKAVLLTALLMEAAAFLFFARFPSAVLNVGLNVIIGYSRGQIEVATNHWVIGVEREGESRLMNFMHAAFCVGAIAGPLGLASLVRNEIGWQLLFPLFGGILLVMAVVMAVVTVPRVEKLEEERKVDAEAQGAAGAAAQSQRGVRPMLAVLAAALLFYVGAELGANNWVAEYFVVGLNGTTELGAAAVAAMWTGLLIGRVSLSLFFRGTRQTELLLALALLSLVSLGALFLVGTAAAGLVLIFLTGLGFSGIFPVVMSLVSRYSRHGAAVGLVTMGAGFGGLIFPFAISLVAEQIGIRGGFLLCLLSAAVITAIAVFLMLHGRHRRPAPTGSYE
jgi:fucose permease